MTERGGKKGRDERKRKGREGEKIGKEVSGPLKLSEHGYTPQLSN